MSKQERFQWILNQLIRLKYINVLDAVFVNNYTTATSADFIQQPYGANTCRQLGRDLSEMYKAKMLKRSPTGIHGAETGFPKWVYVYEVY